MFLLKSLGNIVFGKGDGILVQLPVGSFSYLDPKAASPKNVIYKEASISIRRTAVKFNYELCIAQNSEVERFESESDLLDETEASFLIDECLLFKITGSKMNWIDVESTNRSRSWEFAVSDSKQVSLDLFEETMVSCMFERAFQKSYDSALESEMTAFLNKMNLQLGSVIKKEVSTIQPSTAIKSEKKVVPSEIQQEIHLEERSQAEVAVPGSTSVLLVQAGLYIFDANLGTFVTHIESVSAEIRQVNKFEYVLLVKNQSQTVICQIIEARMNTYSDQGHLSFIWVWYDLKTQLPAISWCLKFEAGQKEDYDSFNQLFKTCLYETVNRVVFENVNPKDWEYVNDIIQDSEMQFDDEEGEEEENDEEDDIFTSNSRKAAVPDDAEMSGGDKSKNSLLAVGYKHDRSFVIRGNKIGVFRHTDRTMDGQFFSPRKVMLHNQDSALLMMKPGDDHSLHLMDLEYGKVTEEWKVDEHKTITDFTSHAKYSQQTGSQSLVGFNDRAIFEIDGRLKGNKIVDEKTKQYNSKLQFTSVATTGKGNIAVGSQSGDIRLYNQLGKNAKTLLPGLGNAIIGIDTTENGKYVLATCKTYLMVIDTEAEGIAKSAFEKSFKAKPVRLQLSPEHVAWLGKEVSFTTARFNTGAGEEKTIVTSTGPFVITWNFRRIKLGKTHDYSIKQYSEDVVADNFKYGADRQIIVALPSNVEMTSKSQLQTPTKLLKSRNSTVNSPY